MTQPLHELWETALGRLSSKVSPQNYDMWLRPIEFVRDEAGTVQLRAPNSYVRLWFESNYLDTILDEIRTVSGVPIRVEFTADAPDGPRAVIDVAPVEVAPTPAPAAEPEPPSELGRLRAATLNPRYTFDTFVAGPSNQLAFAASQAAASAYPPKYNPVFICGGVGLGKTHLLHAIGHTQLSLRPDARIAYISSERFMNEYVNAIRAGKMQEFRTRYREGIDVLLVDDVQFLAGKDGTQDEFFHTFNALHDNHKQIVLTADRKPHEIADIADRLRTRFAWGLLADIEPPELEVRIAILRKKAAVEAIPLPDDVAMFIATSVKSNVRELEGALIRLAAYASLSKREIDLPFAQETLGGAIARPREHITTDGVIKAVASYYGVKASELKSERRHRSIAGPRAVAMYLARQHTKDSYPDLGRAFGGKHHTTVISAVEKIAARLGDDPGLRGEIHAIEATLLR
ncbi:MAG: chromosomal replication initiator protein DnaA [Kofleriaceae bacterium]|nr:chromosomal replication initiator protein DnaA [Kofleriaceae bacterium]MBP9166592.1 chromosomal replication initiator protein DnaA [Kofleriaceae bacterium]MBP9859662.1 chromosomal replication initiator protein DnaA [Kofleriaceae bacterium]